MSKRCSAISLPPAVVADANVVLSALIGGRARLVIASAHGPRCLAVEAVAVEVARHIPRLVDQRGLDSTLLFAALQAMPIDWKLSAEYEHRRQQAEDRIASRDPDDWPTVALALELSLPVGRRTRTSRRRASRCSRRANCSTRCGTPGSGISRRAGSHRERAECKRAERRNGRK